MKNPFKNLNETIKRMNAPEIKLKFTTCGEVLIDGLTYTFGVESVGLMSKKGLVVAISGDAVDSGKLVLDNIIITTGNAKGPKTMNKKMNYITKSDGKKIYQVKCPEICIPCAPQFRDDSDDEKEPEIAFLEQINSEITFKINPKYKEDEDDEIMITVYPLENVLTGAAVEWRDCTSDSDYFLHRSKKSKSKSSKGMK